MAEIIYKNESYKIIGICMDVHNHLGPGFLEIVYKDALEYEFQKAGIPYEREKEYVVNYKEIVLLHSFKADFVAYDKIILEVKAVSGIVDEFIARAIIPILIGIEHFKEKISSCCQLWKTKIEI